MGGRVFSGVVPKVTIEIECSTGGASKSRKYPVSLECYFIVFLFLDKGRRRSLVRRVVFSAFSGSIYG